MVKDDKKWYIVDAKGKILGRIATKIAAVLYGKNKVDFVPNKDNGDYVVVINAKDIKVTGNKVEDKTYYRYSGYPGGMRKDTLKQLISDNPERIIKSAVKGMLPKNKLGVKAMTRLRVYKDEKHNLTKELVNL